MERLENLNLASADNSAAEAASRMLEDLRPDDKTMTKLENNAITAQAIANHFDPSKNEGLSAYVTDEGASMLRSSLMGKANDMNSYNSILHALRDSLNAIPLTDFPGRVELKLKDFDENSGTYKNAYIYTHADSFDSHESYRIVQPGNTLSQIAKDSYDEKVAVNDGQPIYSLSDFQQFIIEKNGLKDQNQIKVGDVLRMYVF